MSRALRIRACACTGLALPAVAQAAAKRSHPGATLVARRRERMRGHEVTLDEVERPLLDLDEHPRQVLADDAERHQLQPAEEQDQRDQRRIARDAVPMTSVLTTT